MLMRTGYHRTMEYVQARLEQLGFDDVRPAHMAIFQNLGPEGARIGELAERAKLTNQSVGYLVDYLEEHGYVERRPDPANRRATLVCFTERGWDEADACAKILDQLDEELTTRMGAERLEQLQALLAEATAALQASKLAIQAPRGRPNPRHPAPSGAVQQPPRGALATYLCGRHRTWSIARQAMPGHPEQNNLHAAIRAACTDLSRADSAFGAVAGAAARRVRSPSVMAVGRRAPSICPHLDRGSRRPDGTYEERAVDKERCR